MADNFSCPTPINRHSTVQMAHGGGGRLMRNLIEQVFLAAFENPASAARHDSAVLDLDGVRVAFTTDSYVVSPLFFPGGDIGTLAVCGTVNDLAMAGARPAYLSAGFILEEGCPLETLQRVVDSMRDTARRVGVDLVTGDTKVVDRGKGDTIYINTAGIGVVPENVEVTAARVRPGDAVLLSGDVGRHGIAIMSVREGLEFEGPIESDCAPLNTLVSALLDSGAEVHCLRDLTRGGLASALNEIAMDGKVGITIDETAVPVTDPVAGACEMLGLDPFYVANEGRLIAFTAESDAEKALVAMKANESGSGTTLIGRVTDTQPGTVLLKGQLGGTRILDLLSGKQLPRIC